MSEDEARAGFLAGVQRRNGKIYEDFAGDVLERLKRMDARMNGCPVISVKAHLDGTVSARFGGQADGVYWERGISINFPFLEHRKFLGDPIAVSETVFELAKRFGAETAAAGIIRA